MTKMAFTTHGWSAHIHAYMARGDGAKNFFLAGV